MASFLGNLTEKGRRGLRNLEAKVGLEVSKEIDNAISEESDVISAYETIVKQRNESQHYMDKWRKTEENPQVTGTIDKMAELCPRHGDAHKEFIQEYKEYVKALESIRDQEVKLIKMQKSCQDLAAKVEKKKATEGQLKGAREERDALLAETDAFVSKTHHDAVVGLAKSHVKLYESCAQVYKDLLIHLENTAAAPAATAPATTAETTTETNATDNVQEE